ncbi:MAG TPA: adenylate/guanylate cyclase domain-containing protein, partial [Planctomycetota bacterium]|nr:adenylate/guanylate cyclase domain-containing protein [Planctomycetota bacterium]
VYDVLFDQTGSAASDREFAKSLANSKGDVLAMKFMVQRDGGRTPAESAKFADRSVAITGTLPVRALERGFVLPIPDLEAGADLLGFVNISPDADKVYRGYDLLRLWTPPGQTSPRAYPSLALAAALASRRATGVARTPSGAITLTGTSDSPPMAAGASARLLLNFRGPEFTFEHVKFVNVLTSIEKVANGEPPLYLAERFRDKIVLVGINAEGYEDIHQTPLSRVFPGVELHATALDNILRGDPLHAPAWDLPLAAAAVATTTAVVFLLPGVMSALLVLALLMLLALLATLLCWANLLVLPVAAPALGGLCAAGSSFLWRLVVEGRQKREIKRAFASYLAPEVLAQVLRDPSSLSLGGETREVTLLFTDLAGFTGLAEHSTPEELVQFLNDYFTRMCEPILQEHGVIDKFIGDAIMALFGAPLRGDDHGLRAVRAALAATAISRQISEGLRAAGKPEIETRIGIHTGPAVVGNMGSSKRFDYTAIGDTVNLASRLEGANKAFGTGCLVSETSWAHVGDAVLGREVGLVGVKGRAEPIRVYEPLALRAQADAALLQFAQRFAAAVAALRAGNRVAAQQAFAALATQRPDDALTHLYLERLADPAWDGVFRLDSK